MHNITCFDEYGNVVYGFTQWDLNQKIYIEDLDFATTPSFHFQNKNTTRALVVAGVGLSNGMISVDVPNQLLVEPYPISVYVYMADGNASKVIDNMQLPVRPRQQPNDFVTQDNIDLIALEDVKKKLEELKANIEKLGWHADNIPYDNTDSGLQGTTVGDALDELTNGLVFVIDEGGGEDTPTDAEKVSDAKSVIEAAIAAMSVSNNTTQGDIQTVVDNALINADITDVIAVVGSINKSNATSSTTGLITGSVSITSGTASDSVAINKVIAQLPESDAEKVSNAKEIIEEAINNMTVTNDTTQSDIQSVVNNALRNAGITDVVATVQNVSVTKATSSNTGTVTGNVAITYGNASDNVAINKTIAKTVKSDADKVAEAKALIDNYYKSSGSYPTNDTLQTHYESNIQTLLNNNNLSDVSFNILNFTKVMATASSVGSITFDVSLTCGVASDSLSIQQTISSLRDYASELNNIKSTLNAALYNFVATSTTYSQTSLGYYLEEALDNAGYDISEIYISTSSLTRTPPTVNTEGSLTGDLKFGFYDYGEQGVITGVNVVIPKLTPDGLDTEYLYYYGNECKDVTNGWTGDNESVSGISCTKNSNYLGITTNNANNVNFVSSPNFTTNKSVRMYYDTTYTLGVEFSISGASSAEEGKGLRVNVSNSGGSSSLSIDVDYSIGDVIQYNSNTTFIPSTGDYTIGVTYMMPMGNMPNMNLKIYRIWYMETA